MNGNLPCGWGSYFHYLSSDAKQLVNIITDLLHFKPWVNVFDPISDSRFISVLYRCQYEGPPSAPQGQRSAGIYFPVRIALYTS